MFGAGNETRTRDPDLGKVVLYQLSYSRNRMSSASDWSGKRDSNSRPRPWQGRALPTELFPHRNITYKFFGAGNETRTRDPDLGKVVLYQLSYSRNNLVVFRLADDWSGKRDSNSRPRPWQGRALPTELFPHRAGLHQCYHQIFGAGNETRTRDPDLGKVVLYQLSYSRNYLKTGRTAFGCLRYCTGAEL